MYPDVLVLKRDVSYRSYRRNLLYRRYHQVILTIKRALTYLMHCGGPALRGYVRSGDGHDRKVLRRSRFGSIYPLVFSVRSVLIKNFYSALDQYVCKTT